MAASAFIPVAIKFYILIAISIWGIGSPYLVFPYTIMLDIGSMMTAFYFLKYNRSAKIKSYASIKNLKNPKIVDIYTIAMIIGGIVFMIVNQILLPKVGVDENLIKQILPVSAIYFTFDYTITMIEKRIMRKKMKQLISDM